MEMQEEEPETMIGEEEEEDDGPPPGFQCIINPNPPQTEEIEAANDEDEEEGPPPGFDAIVPNPTPSSPLPDTTKSTEQDEDDNEDEDGPPPGWEFGNLVNALPEGSGPLSNEADIKMESNEDLDEGPPPGWETVVPHQMSLPSTPPLQSSSSISSDIEMGSRETITRIDHEAPQPKSQYASMEGHSPPPEPPVQQPASSELPSHSSDDKSIADKKPTSVPQPSSPLQQLPPTSRPAKTYSDKAQLVCGTCRKLCVYPRGTKWVQCPGCQEVNFVLEAHEIGQVNCGGCAVLLMYPHGAPAVQCSSCRAVTEIGAHNKRPPLSLHIQQAQRRHRSARTR